MAHIGAWLLCNNEETIGNTNTNTNSKSIGDTVINTKSLRTVFAIPIAIILILFQINSLHSKHIGIKVSLMYRTQKLQMGHWNFVKPWPGAPTIKFYFHILLFILFDSHYDDAASQNSHKSSTVSQVSIKTPLIQDWVLLLAIENHWWYRWYWINTKNMLTTVQSSALILDKWFNSGHFEWGHDLVLYLRSFKR